MKHSEFSIRNFMLLISKYKFRFLTPIIFSTLILFYFNSKTTSYYEYQIKMEYPTFEEQNNLDLEYFDHKKLSSSLHKVFKSTFINYFTTNFYLISSKEIVFNPNQSDLNLSTNIKIIVESKKLIKNINYDYFRVKINDFLNKYFDELITAEIYLQNKEIFFLENQINMVKESYKRIFNFNYKIKLDSEIVNEVDKTNHDDFTKGLFNKDIQMIENIHNIKSYDKKTKDSLFLDFLENESSYINFLEYEIKAIKQEISFSLNSSRLDTFRNSILNTIDESLDNTNLTNYVTRNNQLVFNNLIYLLICFSYIFCFAILSIFLNIRKK